MEEYYKDLISKTSNPVFKEYYNSMLNYYKRGEKPLIKNFKFKMDMENMKHYPESDFMEALEYIGVFEK